MKLVTIFIIILLACAYPAAMSRTLPKKSSSSVDEVFQQWMLEYNRTYSNSTEMKIRKEIFKKTLESIENFNSTAAGYTIGVNQFADYSYELDHCDCLLPNEDFHL
ncbi:cathepsin propeptide inhibitor domain protein [Medicago truncatula]|uniref:Cathepsin propeptide inhibitor domain protein n=1 Tax=Medicago truncatula TaxID=3880 RepID=A0A072VIX4_MEDTR|nr:cathepsin propeptide inhibitor domain protein [Medicago truncatula]